MSKLEIRTESIEPYVEELVHTNDDGIESTPFYFPFDMSGATSGMPQRRFKTAREFADAIYECLPVEEVGIKSKSSSEPISEISATIQNSGPKPMDQIRELRAMGFSTKECIQLLEKV